MASPYQIGPPSDTGLQSPLYQEDYSFLQQGLARRSSLFEQGLTEVKNDYASVLSQPTLGDEAAQRKQQYIEQVQQGLKKVASTDLSMPQNVQQAENLYAPFWQDGDLLANTSLAKYYQNENSKLDGWQNSTDPTIRNTYSDDARTYLQQGMQKVAKAPLDKNAYAQLKRRAATPVYDIDSDVDALWEKESKGDKDNSGVTTTTTYGNQDVIQHNGIQSKDAFKTWYLSKVGSKYDAQIAMRESVRIQNAKDQILQQNPGLSEKELNEHFASEQMDGLNSSYNGAIESYNKTAGEWNKKYTDLYATIHRQGNKASPEDIANLQYYQNQVKQYTGQSQQYITEFQKYGAVPDATGKYRLDPNSDYYKKTFREMSEHGDDYLAGIEKERMADRWATGRANMNVSTQLKLNESWNAYAQEADKAADRVLKQREIDATNRGHNLTFLSNTGIDPTTGQRNPFYRNDQGGWSTDTKAGKGSGTDAAG